MILGGLQKSTLIDFPGKVAATVFISGCSLRCPWCYSPELVLPQKIKQHPRVSEKFFFDFLEKRKGLLDGVVVCGGEPTFYKTLPAFIEKIKELGYLVKLDTNGFYPVMLARLIKEQLVDYVALDIKLPKEKYQAVLGIDTKNIEKSAALLKRSFLDYEFRTTVVPTIHTKEDIIQIAKWLGPAKKYYLQNFRPEKTLDPSFKKIKPYSKAYLYQIQKRVAPLFEICQIR